MKKRKRDSNPLFNKPIKKILLIGIVIYIASVVAFYFLADNQLYYRQSRGNLAMSESDALTCELSAGDMIEQSFTPKIQRLESLSVLWGDCSRANQGTLTLELVRAENGEVLLQKQFNVSELWDHEILTVTAESPIETIYDTPVILRAYADSPKGLAGVLFRNIKAQAENFALSMNGEAFEGMLCFTAEGTDYIWIGLHYWEIMVVLGIVMLLLFMLAWYRMHSEKHSYIMDVFIALNKYRFLIRQLVFRDFKTKYKRSILGVFWSFLNPLLMMLVQYYVFSTLFDTDVPYFAAYLIIGSVMFNFFSESVGLALSSILENAGLITKVYMPKYIYPLTRVLSSLVNLTISWIPMIIVCLITGVHFQKSAILALFFMFCLVVFCLGMGLLLSTSMVFFRDTKYLWGVLNMIWMYATPIFYPEKILPDNLKAILMINPMYHFIKNARMCLLNGASPEPIAYIQCMLIAFGMLLIGAVIFKKEQDKFVIYL